MMTKFKISVFVLIFSTTLFAQDIHFSQPILAPLNLNPALSGANYDYAAYVNYKTQWRSVTVPYKTIGASYDMRIRAKKSKSGYFGAGLNFFRDNAGTIDIATTIVNLNLAYHLYLNKTSTLGAGLYGGFTQRSLNLSKGTWGNQYTGKQFDAGLPTGEVFNAEQFGFVDAGAGVLYRYDKAEGNMTSNDNLKVNVGVAVFHVGEPNYSFVSNEKESLSKRFSFFANGEIGISSTNVALSPALYYNQQGKATEIIVGSYVIYQLQDASKYTGLVQGLRTSVGAFYRNKDAVILSGMLQWSNYGLGISYDLNTSSLAEASKRKGGIEVSLKYTGIKSKSK